MKTLFFVMALLMPFTARATCTAPWGAQVQEGSFVTAYSAATSSPGQMCQSQMRMCHGGFLSGFYSYPSCVEDHGCQTEFGYLRDGASVTAYASPMAEGGQHCQSEIRQCSHGFFSGTYNNLSCTQYP